MNIIYKNKKNKFFKEVREYKNIWLYISFKNEINIIIKNKIKFKILKNIITYKYGSINIIDLYFLNNHLIIFFNKEILIIDSLKIYKI